MKAKTTIISVLKYTATLSVAFGLLWYAFRGISITDMIQQLSKVKFGWIYLSISLSVFSHILRAYRWQILLHPLHYQIKLTRSFWAVMIGYLANLAFPRMGEITKCGVLKKTDGVKVSQSMGTVVTERIFDLLSLILILVITFAVEFDRLNQFFLDLAKQKLSSGQNDALSALLVVGVIILVSSALIIIVFKKKIFGSIVYRKFKSSLINFKDGLVSIRKIENVPGFILSTIGIWVLYYLMAYVIVFAIPETSDLNWIAGLSILVVGGIAMSAPVQGGIGTYHFLIAALLTLYGIERDQGVFFATILHTSQTLAVMFFGGIGLVVISFLKKHQHETD